jgi:hypothetical protein
MRSGTPVDDAAFDHGHENVATVLADQDQVGVETGGEAALG